MQTEIPGFTLRLAEERDVQTILNLIIGIAEYEKLANEVEATETILYQSLFVQKSAEVLLGEYEGVPVGFILFFHNFSTFTGRRGLYIEDFFVLPEMRHRGFGKTMFLHIARIAQERECGRMEWVCLDWNTPSIAFYKKLGAIPMEGWHTYRLTAPAIKQLLATNKK